MYLFHSVRFAFSNTNYCNLTFETKMSAVTGPIGRIQVTTDYRNPKTIKANDARWKGNTPSTLKKVNKILHCYDITENLDKADHGFDWNRFNLSEQAMPSSLTVHGNEDGVTAEYRNPEKTLTPGCMDSTSLYYKKAYKQGTHVFEVNVTYFSPIQYNSHIHLYIGVGVAHEDDEISKICRWWLSLTKMMFIQYYTKDPSIPAISQYPFNSMEVPQKFLMVLDMDVGTLGFVVNDKYLGPAFGGLCGRNIIPNISYYGNVDCDIKMEYIGAYHEPETLKEICGKRVHQLVRKDAFSNGTFEELNLPESLNKLVTDINE